VYEERGRRRADGKEIRVLVDRVWPRGISREQLALTEWARELGPSTELRKWFGHDPDRWNEFRRRYRAELSKKSDQLKAVAQLAQKGRLVLLYSAKDEEHNQAVVLKDVLEELVR
jgi:uncharacterized protein YeaO (DUF488 family)